MDKNLNDLMADDNRWEVNGEIQLNDRIEFHIDNQLEDGMDEIWLTVDGECSVRNRYSCNGLLVRTEIGGRYLMFMKTID